MYGLDHECFYKYESLGNTFLVLVVPETDLRSSVCQFNWKDVAKEICDPISGVSADGLIVAGTPETDVGGETVTMNLRNADGSKAETSGNGLACLAATLAALRENGSIENAGSRLYEEHGALGWRFRVQTGAGIRHVTWFEDGVQKAHGNQFVYRAEVDMEIVTDGPPITPALEEAIKKDWPDAQAATRSVGNPHLVIKLPRALTVDETISFGKKYQMHFADGINVEFVFPRESSDSITISIWERGAGLTRACGSGAIASAHQAREWGIVHHRRDITVSMPGGDALVPNPRAGIGQPLQQLPSGDYEQVPTPLSPRLLTDAHYVASVDWPIGHINHSFT